jgi:hypothetical protein
LLRSPRALAARSWLTWKPLGVWGFSTAHASAVAAVVVVVVVVTAVRVRRRASSAARGGGDDAVKAC